MTKELKSNEIVIIKVKRITNYGAIVEILDYPEYEGFLHVSEIVSKWVKNISDYIKVGMKTAALILEVDKEKKVVTLSLKRLNEEQKIKALEDYENNKKASKILEEVIKKSKEKIKLESVKKVILNEYENLYDFVLDISDEGGIVAKELGFSEKFSTLLEEYVRKVLKKKEINIKLLATFELHEKDGISIIKQYLSEIEKLASVHYMSAQHYIITLKADDYKKAKQNKSKGKVKNEKQKTQVKI